MPENSPWNIRIRPHSAAPYYTVRHRNEEHRSVSSRRPKQSVLCALRELHRPMNRRPEKSEMIPNDRRRSPRMRGPAAGGKGEASVPPAFAAIVRVVPPPTSSFFPPRLPHLRHLRNLRFRNGRCSGGVSGFSLCLRAFVVNIWANQSPLQMASAGMPAAGQPSRQP